MLIVCICPKEKHLRLRSDGLVSQDSPSKTTEPSWFPVESKKISKPNMAWIFFGTPKENRTPDSAVRGRRLNRLTMRACKILNCMERSSLLLYGETTPCKALRWTCPSMIENQKPSELLIPPWEGERQNHLTMRACKALRWTCFLLYFTTKDILT